MTILIYLQTGFKRTVAASGNVAQMELPAQLLPLHAELLQLRDAVEKATGHATRIAAGDRSALVQELRTQITAEANSAVLEELKAQVAESNNRVSDKELFARFDESRARLTSELEALGRRGNLNLALGAVTTLVGLVFLGFSVISELTATKEPWDFVSHFAPRMTLVVMIELFAYFFLSLYKASLIEIKYFQNELTNIEAKQVALRAALSYGDQSIIATILGSIAATERNHVLSKDQTTVELEKARIEKDSKSELAKFLAEFFNKKA